MPITKILTGRESCWLIKLFQAWASRMSVWVGKVVFWKIAPIGAGKGLIKATAAPTVAETRAVKLRVN